MFLASRACENSTVQDAIGVRRVVEDVQETSYRANYLRLTTLPVRTGAVVPPLPTHLSLSLSVEILPGNLSKNSKTVRSLGIRIRSIIRHLYIFLINNFNFNMFYVVIKHWNIRQGSQYS